MFCDKMHQVFDHDEGAAGGSLSQHISECADCRQVRDILDQCKHLPPRPVPVDITSQILKRIDDVSLRKTSRFGIPFLNFITHPLTVPIGAIIILLAVLVGISPQKKGLTKVTFTVPLDNVHHVALVGDFNNWDPEKGQLHRKGDQWSGTFYVVPGRYQYMLVIDGNQWLPDPAAKEYVDDGYGNRNSLLDTTQV